MIKYTYYCFLIFVLGSIFSCNDAAFIDTNLVDVDLLDIQVEDNFDISSLTLEEDSILIFGPGQNFIPRYPFGIADDPVFGRTTASTVFQPYLTTTSPPSFEGAVVNSVVLELAFNQSVPFYGDTTGVLGIEVFEVTETLDAASDLFDNFTVETGSEVIGQYEGVANFRDSIETFRIQGDTIFDDTYPAHIRIPLLNSYGERIITAGNDVLTSTTDFVTTFQGLELRPTNENEGLVSFDFNSFSSSNGVNVNGANILIYYTIAGQQRQYNLTVNTTFSVKFPQYQQDYSGSTVGEFLMDEMKGDSLIFVQGMSGSNAVVRLEDVDRLQGALINGATLEVFGTALNDDEDIRPVPDQLVLRSIDDNGDLNLIRDFQSASLIGSLAISGGIPEDMGNGIYKYSFEIVSELQDIIEGSSNELYILTNNKIATMNRVVLFGADHSTYPIRLNVTYTKL